MENGNNEYKGLHIGWTIAAVIDAIVVLFAVCYIWIYVFLVSFVILLVLVVILNWDNDRRLGHGIERWHRPWWWGL